MDETSIVTSYILANMIPDNAALLDNESDNLYRALKTEVERVLIGANFLRYSESEDTAKKYTDALIDLYPENMAKLVLAFLVDKLKRGRIFYKSVYTPGRTLHTVLLVNQLFEISGSVGKENDPHWQVVFIDGIKSQTKLLQVLKNDDEFTEWCMKKLHTIERFSSDYSSREEIWKRGDNLDEANKYFFGTEDTNEVKKLFESELGTDSDVMFTFEDTEESRMDEFLLKLKNATKQSLFAAKYRLCVLYSFLHSAKTRQVFDLHSNSNPEIKASLKKNDRIPEYTEILFYCIDKCLPENFTEFDSINLAFAVDINADEEYYHKPGREIQKSLTIIRNDLKKSFSKFFDVKDLYFDVDRNCYTVIVSVDYHL